MTTCAAYATIARCANNYEWNSAANNKCIINIINMPSLFHKLIMRFVYGEKTNDSVSLIL